MLARLRERTLGRGLESLRTGEGLRWVRLLARYSPSRALALAREELDLAPLEPELWRALAEAELSAGHWTAALATLETIQAVAPEREAARLLLLTAFRVDSDARQFQRRLGQLTRMDESAPDDPLVAFYRLMADMRLATKDTAKSADGAKSMELWSQLTESGLAESRLGRAFAITHFETGKRAPALQVLARARASTKSALEQDLFAATEYLISAAPEKPRVLEPAPAKKEKEQAAGGAATGNEKPAKKAPRKPKPEPTAEGG
jgi:tetratricopeptide (TPR) repeat protein